MSGLAVAAVAAVVAVRLPGLEVAETFRGRLVLRFLVLVERAGRQATNGRKYGSC